MGYVFDLDGTLVDSVPTLLRVINTVLGEYSLKETDREENLSVAGWGLITMFEKTIAKRIDDPDMIELLVEKMLTLYKHDPITGTRGYPGAFECLKALQERDECIGLITNKLLYPTRKILSANFPGIEFTKIYTPDGGWEPKPSSQSLLDFKRNYTDGHLVYVGDTELDYMTSYKVADEVRLATWGYRGREKLLKDGFPEDILIEDFTEVM